MLGTAVTRQLAIKKYKIIAVTSCRRRIEYPKEVIAETANLLDVEEQRKLLSRVKPDKIIHLAWSLDGPGFLKSAMNIQWLEASLSLLRGFRGEQFLFAGSSAEYGSGDYCKEEDLCHPDSIYGECKLAFERTAEPYCKTKGIQFVCTRFFSVYGPYYCRKGRALPTAIRAFLNDEKFVSKSPNNAWDYIFAEDIGKITSAILESDLTGAVNVSSGKAVTMRDVFSNLASVMGKEKNLSFENEEIPGKHLVGDNRKLCAATGFKDFTSLRDGLEKTVLWWMSDEIASIRSGE